MRCKQIICFLALILGFSFQAFAQSPGGVSANIEAWFKADVGVVNTGNGTAATAWNNQTGRVYNLTQTTTGRTRPTYYNTDPARLINFNPTLSFVGTTGAGGQNLMNTTALMPSSSGYTFMGVNIDELTTVAYNNIFAASPSNSDHYFTLHKHNRHYNLYQIANRYLTEGNAAAVNANSGNTFSATGGSNGYWSGTARVDNTAVTQSVQPQIFAISSLNTGTGLTPLTSFIDGYKVTSTNGNRSDFPNKFGTFSVGGYITNRYSYTGRIPEIMAYSRQLTDQEIQRINTYLSIKYGTTLGQGGALANINRNAANYNYLASNGNVIWNASNNAGYNYNITGIGRDDASGLVQKQSKSANRPGLVTIGKSNIVTTNADNTGTFAADRDFLLFGDNNGGITSFTSAGAPTYLQKLNRTWKVSEIGTDASDYVLSVPSNSSSLTIKLPSLPNPGDLLYLVVDNDTDFSNGAVLTAMSLVGTSWVANTIDLDDGQFYTFAAGPDLTDTDGDGVIDLDDLDDDNDGIFDINECLVIPFTSNEPYMWNITNANVNTSNIGLTPRVDTITPRTLDAISNQFSGQGNTISFDEDPNYTFINLPNGVINTGVFYNDPDDNPDLGQVYEELTYADTSWSVESTFDLTGFNIAQFPNFTLAGEFYSDDSMDVYLNGNLIASPSNDYFEDPEFFTTTLATSGVINAGINTIRIDVANNANSTTGLVFNFEINFGCDSDIDSDGIFNHLDLDSDSDGCFDSLEGDAPETQIGYTELNPDGSIAGGVDTNGVPNTASGGQGIGTSQDSAQQAAECSPCDINNPEYVDTDGDLIGDFCDLDDDNDGILDSDEGCTDISKTVLWMNNTGERASEQYVIDELRARGYTVIIADDDETHDLNNYGISFIFEDVSAGALSNLINFSTTSNTVITSRASFYDELIFSAAIGATDGNTTSIDIINNTHPITVGLPLGILNIVEADNYIPTLASGTQLGNRPAGGVSLAVWEAGEPLEDGSLALGKRAIVPHTNNFNNAGGDLLVSVISWGTNEFIPANCTDTDGDGIIDSLDLDSDNDGCPDALEGDAPETQIGYAELNPDGSIAGGVDTDGIPNTASGGQGIGTSQDVNLQAAECSPCDVNNPNFVDTDGDLVGDYCDLDDDNDGILDSDEFGCNSLSDLIFTNITVASPTATEVITNNGTAITFDLVLTNVGGDGFESGADGNFALGDMWTDEPTSASGGDALSISADAPVTYILSNKTNSSRGFDDGDYWRLSALGGFNVIDPDNQLNIISNSGDVIHFRPVRNILTNAGTWQITTKSPVQDILIEANGNPWTPARLSFCSAVDTDGDNTPDYLDLDSDNDGCPDALEGDALETQIGYSELNPDDSITGSVDANGIPNTAAGGQGVGTSQNAAQQAAECSPCNTNNPEYVDSDGDGVGDFCDLDNDNDGILNIDECRAPGFDAYWAMENSTDDSSSNSYNATAVNISFTSDSYSGEAAASFNGIDQFISYDDGTFLNQAITSFTYSFWIKPNTLSGIQTLLDEGGNFNGVAIRLNGNQLESVYRRSNTPVFTESLTFPADGEWHHVALTFNAGIMTLYLDAVKSLDLDTLFTDLPAHGNNHGFGATRGQDAFGTASTGNYFNGSMDEIYHYPYALNENQIKTQFSCDTDDDGILNSFESDSDNDGCNDTREAGYTDIDNNDEVDGSGYNPNGTVSGSNGYTVIRDGDNNNVPDFQEAGTAPAFTSQPVDINLCPGCNGTISASLTDADTFQWQIFNGTDWDDLTDTGIYSTTTTAVLTLTEVTPADNGNRYRLLASNSTYNCTLLTSDEATLTTRVTTVITNRQRTYRVNKN